MKILTLCTTITLELSKNCLTIRHVEVSYMFIILNSAQFKLLNFALNKDNIFPNQFLENSNRQQKFIIFGFEKSQSQYWHQSLSVLILFLSPNAAIGRFGKYSIMIGR